MQIGLPVARVWGFVLVKLYNRTIMLGNKSASEKPEYDCCCRFLPEQA